MLISLEDVGLEEVLWLWLWASEEKRGSSRPALQLVDADDVRDDATMSRLLSTIHSLLFSHMAHSTGSFFFSWLPLTWANCQCLSIEGWPAHATDPTSADHWVRHLEEEAGAICESRVDVGASANATGAAAGAGPGPSTLSSRRSALSNLKAVGYDFISGVMKAR